MPTRTGLCEPAAAEAESYTKIITAIMPMTTRISPPISIGSNLFSSPVPPEPA